MTIIKRILERDVKENELDQAIIERAGEPTEKEIYQARWVWYHTILAVEIAFTNILLIAILVSVILK
jgi:hypothetical protein